MQKLQMEVCGLYALLYVHVCVPWQEAVQHSPMLQALNREWENVLTTAVNEGKKEKKGEKRSAVKVAEAHKRKERERVSYP